MALIECPECGKQISENADSCPQCGNPMKKKKEVDDQKKASNSLGCTAWLLIIGAVAIFSIFIMSSLSNSGGGGSSNYQPEHNTGMAWQMTQDFVERRLSSPSTAEFPYSSNSDVEITQNGRTYNVKGYVDSQNNFGAMIRTNFEAELRYDGDGTWSLITLEFE